MTRPSATRRATAATFTLLTFAATAAGCTSTPTAPPGSVAGMLLRVGGPAPGAPVPLPGQITATAVEGGSSVTVSVSKDGQYKIHLPPGAYRFTGTSPLIQDAKMTCSAPHIAHVSSGKTTVGVKVICSIR